MVLNARKTVQWTVFSEERAAALKEFRLLRLRIQLLLSHFSVFSEYCFFGMFR